MFLALQRIQHFFHKVIYIQQFKFNIGVIHLNRQIMSDIVAEGGYGRVVIRSAPFPKEIWETIHQYLGTRLLLIGKKQILTRLLAPSILGISESSCQ